MKFYSRLEINIVSLFLTIIIYIFIIIYIPQTYKIAKNYLYYKKQPNIIREYEEQKVVFYL